MRTKKVVRTSIPGLVKRGDNFWGRVAVGGKEFKRSFGPDFQVARDALGPWRREVQLRAASGVVTERGVTVGDLVAAVVDRIDQDPTKSDNYRVYIRDRAAHLRSSWPGLAGMAPEALTTKACNAWVVKVGAGASVSTIQGDLVVLRTALADAVARGMIMVNPVNGVKAKRPAQVLHVSTACEISRDDFARVLAEMRRREEKYKFWTGMADLAELFSLTGMRLRQATALVWGDVDFDRGLVKKPHSKRRAAVSSGIRSAIPMYPRLRTFLTELKARSAAVGAGDRVTVVKTCRGSLANACKAVGIPRLHHHDMRHLFSTWAIEVNIDIPAVADILGHKDGGALLMKTYRHLRPAHLVSAVQKLG